MNLSFKILGTAKILLFLSLSGSAQIKYEKTYQDALQKAASGNKIIFINVGTPQQMMGMKFRTLSDDPNVADFYNNNFVSYNMTVNAPEFPDYRERYQLTSFPALFFLNAAGSLIYKAPRHPGSVEDFLAYAREAQDRAGSGRSLSDYEQKYKSGTIGKEELKDYIRLKIQSGLFDNSELADRYVDHLTIAELSDYQNILFILQAGPVAYGKAYKFAYTDGKTADSIYRTEPVDQRITMNNRIIGNTLRAAVAKKDHNLFNNLTSFIRNIYGRNYRDAENEILIKSIAFYKAINDTTKFYLSATRYYDQQYMGQNVDSLRKIAVKNQQTRDDFSASISQAGIKKRPAPQGASGLQSSVVTVVRRTVTVPGANSVVANALNAIAWEFYTTGTRNINHLSKAMQWSIRSIQIDPSPAHYDTLAHIFYRMGLFDEALLNQKKAIALLTGMHDQKQQLAEAKAEAEKMKQRTL